MLMQAVEQKIILLGNVHADSNQIRIVAELMELLSPDDWMFGLENPDNEDLQAIKSRLQGGISRDQTAYEAALKKFGSEFKNDSLSYRKLAFCGLEEAREDPAFSKFANHESFPKILPGLINKFCLMRACIIKCNICELLIDNNFEGISLEDPLLNAKMEAVWVAQSADKLAKLNGERENFIVEKIISLVTGGKKNLIILIGMAHVPTLTKLIKSKIDATPLSKIEVSSYAIAPTHAQSCCGKLQALEDANQDLIKIAGSYDIKIINSANELGIDVPAHNHSPK
jgi:hypothetical protein